MDDVGQYAISMLYKAQKALKAALAVDEATNAKPEEVATLRMKIKAVDWLIGLAIKED